MTASSTSALSTITSTPFASAGLAGALAVVWGELLFTRLTLVHDNVLRLFHPYLAYGTERLQGGSAPLWTPFLFGGMSFAANPQAMVWSPSALPFRLLPFGPATAGFEWGHGFVAALGGWLLARHWGATRGGAWLCGFATGAGAFQTGHGEFFSHVASLAWMPCALLLTRSPWAGGAVWALLMLGGHPQFAWYAGAACLAVSARTVLRPVLLGAGLAAVLLIPFAALLSDSVRAGASGLAAARDYALPLGSLAGLLLTPFAVLWRPFEGDPHITVVGVGIGAALLAVLGAAGRSQGRPLRGERTRNGTDVRVRSTTRTSGTTLLLMGALLAAGAYAPIAGALPWLPGWGAFRFPAQAGALVALGAALLAAAGAARRTRGVVLAAALLALAELSTAARVLNPLARIEALRGVPPLVEAIRRNDTRGPVPGPALVVVSPRTREARPQSASTAEQAWARYRARLLPNTGLVEHIADADGYEVLRPREWGRRLDEAYAAGPDSSRWGALGVRYLVSDDEVKSRQWKLMWQEGIRLYRRGGPSGPPRAGLDGSPATRAGPHGGDDIGTYTGVGVLMTVTFLAGGMGIGVRRLRRPAWVF